MLLITFPENPLIKNLYSNHLKLIFTELLQKVPTAQIKLEFSGSCPNDQNLFAFNLFYAFYSMDLCSPPDASYQSGADLCNQRNFRGIKCSGLGRRKRDTQTVDSRFTVEMDLWQIQRFIFFTSYLFFLFLSLGYSCYCY